MAITNKNKDEKNPILTEIENDDTPIDKNGNPIDGKTHQPDPQITELLAKDPNELTAADMDVLSKNKLELTDQQKVTVGLMDEEDIAKDDEVVTPPVVPVVPPQETPEEKDKRYKSQQAEAQIQNEKNKAYTEKVEEASKLTATEDELRAFVKQDGAEWDELTTFEQAMAKRTFLGEKKFNLVHEAVQASQKVDAWAKTVDDFIESTDGKPEYLDLSSHESEFRKYSMKESHRGTPIDVLLGAFLHQLPPEAPNRQSLFNRGGGGEKTVIKTGITDAEQAAQLRIKDPREYKRQVKAGKIKIEI